MAKRNAGHPLLRTALWAAVATSFFVATHPATSRTDSFVGLILAATSATVLLITRNK